VSLDPERWPQGRLPVHSTWEEWRQGELSEATRCPSCHMPPEPGVANSADLQEFPNAEVGVQGGWLRPAGAVRQHSWLGPRQPQSQMLQLAASLRVTTKVIREGQLEVEITTTNSGAGHAIPTGEPLRSILLVVEAFCGEQPLAPVGGDVVPDFGGALAQKGAGEDWTRWPQAQPGDTLQAVRYADAWRDYDGVSPFQRGGLAPEHKGMRQEVWAGQATVASVEQGVVTLDGALPQADAVYLQRPALGTWAGSPGFGFARVMVGAQGERMVPHFRAVDVASDNRLMPGASFASRHLFEALCTDPVVRARLIHRAAPLSLALPRGWERRDSVMVEVER
jgi:hypothetical protein